MPRKLDLVCNIIDIETTCWEKQEDKFYGEEQDVIEVGIVEYSFEGHTILNKESILVIPERSTISDFCTKLTTLTTQQVLEGGVSFSSALKYLRKCYNSTGRTWASWGAFDRLCFQHQCEDYGIPYKAYFSRNHINLKNLYSIMNGLPYELGMAGALEREGIPLEGTHHRGHDDAHNIAKIARNMFRK